MLAATETPATESELTIAQIVRRAAALYSLPAVAVDVLRLTDLPKVDVRALKECIERDPALTAKILRVVNSSLFGLPREVGDLNQALALLGIKPLKLLVLGFSLPENLFLEVAGDQLTWYWNVTLARAVAAREISEQLFNRPGDDAFLAGLLEGLGVLVLLRELGAPYAALVSRATTTGDDLQMLEREALGFDHAQLTAKLLEQWNMPPALVQVISEPRDHRVWAHHRAAHAPLVRVLHLAELFAQLVGQHRLSVLPDLLEVGDAYCQLDKPQLNDLIAGLEPKVRQLASVLSLDSILTGQYADILAKAHDRMSRLVETAAAPLSSLCGLDDASPCDATAPAALALATDLQQAVDRFLHRGASGATAAAGSDAIAGRSVVAQTPVDSSAPRPPQAYLRFHGPERDEFDVRLKLAVGHCRSTREPLSVVLLGVAEFAALEPAPTQTIERLLDAVCSDPELSRDIVERPAPNRRILVLAGRDRREAITAARRCVEHLRQLIAPLTESGQLAKCRAAAGVASVGVPAKNFQSSRLLETAQRCLDAALASGGVKSLEVS